MTIMYKDAEEVSLRFANRVVQQLSEFSEKLPQVHGDELARATFPKEALVPLYRMSMMKSLLSLVTIELPAE